MKTFNVRKSSKNWSSSLNRDSIDVTTCILKVLEKTEDLHEVITITIEADN